MALAHHYRILGLRTGASFGDVKLAYRNLVRLYHPDVNPGDQLAKEKFIQVTQAYQALIDALPHTPAARSAPPAAPAPARPQPAASGAVEAIPLSVSPIPGGTDTDQRLKVTGYQQLQGYFREQRFPRAVALVEGLAQRFPDDPEIRQWHAITYYHWGHDLLNQGNLAKAEICLKKARRVDPHNKSLRQALQQDLLRLEQHRQAPMPQAQ